MKWMFWTSAVAIAYTYLGYPGWLWLRCRWRPKPVRSAAYTPFVSIVMVVRNESAAIERKLRNLLNLSYPAQLCEIVVVSDGSSDGTGEIISGYADQVRIRLLTKPKSQGKTAGINDAVQVAKGEIVIFTDARQRIEPDAVRLLVEDFADSTIGCSSGELMLGDPEGDETQSRMGLYWKLEKKVREMESRCGSVVGATGAFYAVRRDLLVPILCGTILDDVFVPMNVVRQGHRVVFNSKARAWDLADQGLEREFSRKVRTLSGNYQLLQLAPWLLSRRNPILFRFASHKLMRLAVPFALVAMLVASLFLRGPIYRIALGGQLTLYALAAVSMTRMASGLLARVADAAFTFVVLNTAAGVACAKFVTGRKVAWGR